MAKNHQKMTWDLTMGCLQPRVDRFQQKNWAPINRLGKHLNFFSRKARAWNNNSSRGTLTIATHAHISKEPFASLVLSHMKSHMNAHCTWVHFSNLYGALIALVCFYFNGVSTFYLKTSGMFCGTKYLSYTTMIFQHSP
jgi:hypothetical protein